MLTRRGDGGPLDRKRAPSFVDGALAPFQGAAFILRSPRAWPAAALPALLALLIAGVLIWQSFDSVGPWLSEWLLPHAEGGLAEATKVAVRWLGSLVGVYLSLLAALALAPIASAPALEHLVRLQEQALGADPRQARGFWFELRCELEAQWAALLVLVPVGVVLWVLGLLVPPLLPLLAPLHAVLVALAIAWNLLGYPLTLRGVNAGSRLRLMRRHALAVLGFGAAFAAVSIIPGAAVLLLPAGVVGATRLTERMAPEASA